MKKYLLSYILLFIFGLSYSYTVISSCTTITTGDFYEVKASFILNLNPNSLTTPPPSEAGCINITTSNVVLNLNGGTITNAKLDDESGIFIYNATGNGRLTNITIANGTITNSEIGIYVLEARNVMIQNVTIHDSSTGILVGSSASSCNIISNNIFNMAGDGISLGPIAQNNSILSNIIHNCNGDGIYISNGKNITVKYNTLYSNSRGIAIYSNTIPGWYGNCSTCSFLFNNISNSAVAISLRGFSVIKIFSGNIILNANTGILLSDSSSLIFSGNNIINLTPAGGRIFNISNGSLSTGSYTVTTQYLPFALTDAKNVSIQVINFSAVSGLTTVSSILGKSITGAKVVQSLWGNYYGLKVTSENVGSSISPKMYYNTSDVASPYSTSYLGIGTSTLGNTWKYWGATVSGSSVSVSGINSMGYLALIAYYYASPAAPPVPSSEQVYVTPTTSFDCKTGVLIVTISQKVNGGTIKLIDKTPPLQNPVIAKIEGGKATFIIKESGTYTLTVGSFPFGYSMNDKTETYTFCKRT